MANLIEVQNRSKSRPNDPPYTTAIDASGRFVCDCRGWTTAKPDPFKTGQNKPRFCSHCEEIQKKYNLATKNVVEGKNVYVYATDLAKLSNNDGTPNPVVASAKNAKARKPSKPTNMVDGIKIIDCDDDDDEVIAAPVLNPVAYHGVLDMEPVKDGFLYVDPMLAAPMPGFEDAPRDAVLAQLSKYASGDWALEEKFDGHRVIVAVHNSTVKAWSRPRSGKAPIVRQLPKHVEEEFKTFPDCTLDGEDYVPGGMSTDVTDLANINKRRFVVFDITSVSGQDATGQTYDARRELLETMFACVGGNNVTLADSVKPTAAYVRKIWARGGEGAILKRRSATYQAGRRSADFIKLKGKESCVVEVIGFEKGKLGPRSVIKVRNPKDGSETKVAAMGGGKELVEDMNAKGDQYIGRKARIEYQLRTPDGSYRHPVWDRWENQ